MIQNDDVKMLVDLSRIVDKYGPGPLVRLASMIRDPQSAADLALALETVAERISNKRTSTKPKVPHRVGLGVLKSIKDPQTRSATAELRDLLVSGAVLKTMGELRAFAWMHDLSIGSSSSRTAAIAPFLQSVSELPVAQILDLLDLLAETGTNNRGLESWRDLIVKQPSKQD